MSYLHNFRFPRFLYKITNATNTHIVIVVIVITMGTIISVNSNKTLNHYAFLITELTNHR